MLSRPHEGPQEQFLWPINQAIGGSPWLITGNRIPKRCSVWEWRVCKLNPSCLIPWILMDVWLSQDDTSSDALSFRPHFKFLLESQISSTCAHDDLKKCCLLDHCHVRIAPLWVKLPFCFSLATLYLQMSSTQRQTMADVETMTAVRVLAEKKPPTAYHIWFGAT